eukprot:EG_transcript_897
MPLLAGIFRGNVTRWDDPQIAALNPSLPAWGVPPGQPIEVVVRREVSAISQLFRKALGASNADFARATGPTNGSSWGTAQPTAISTNQGVLSYVRAAPYTIGYTSMGEGLATGLGVASLLRGTGHVVAPSQEAVGYALLELGGRFGLDDADPNRLTASLCNAINPLAWPIVGYSYVAIRKNTLRAGATQDSFAALMQFLKWFLTSEAVPPIVARYAFSPLPVLLSQVVLLRIDKDIQIHNNKSGSPEVPEALLSGAGPAEVVEVLRPVVSVYSSLKGVPAQLTVVDGVPGIPAAPRPLSAFPFWLSTTRSTPVVPANQRLSPLPSPDMGQRAAVSGPAVLVGGMGVVAVSGVDAVLDVPTLARILEGTITMWLDPAIRRLNPGGVFTAAGAPVSNASQSIQLLRGPVSTSATVEFLLRAFYPAYTGRALRQAANVTSGALRGTAAAYPYSLALTTLSGVFPAGLRLLPLQRTDGAIVAPTVQSIELCATPDVFDPKTGSLRLFASPSPSCYPLSAPVYLNLPPSACERSVDPAESQAVQFAKWGVDPATAATLPAARLATFASLPAVAAFNARALAALSCGSGTSATGVLAVSVGVGVGGGGFLAAVVAALVVALRWGRRDLRRAPTDPGRPFCVVFTDIESSTVLWAKAPAQMATALQAHHALIRDLIPRFKLYEVKTIGDSFMCVTPDCRQALDFALELQARFHAHDWGTTALDDVYHELAAAGRGSPKRLAAVEHFEPEDPSLWNGLRVRVGLHHGVGDITFDPVAKGYDYYGTVVNCAARIMEACHGGQTAVSQAFKEELPADYDGGLWLDLGLQPLKGLEPMRLFQVLPAGLLSRRQFPPLRLFSGPAEGLLGDLASDCLSHTLPSPMSFSPNGHPLVLRGFISAPELHLRYVHAMAALRVLLCTQTPAFRNQILSGICGRLKVRLVGNTGPQLTVTLHRLVLRLLPALATNSEPLPHENTSASESTSVVGGSGRNRSRGSLASQEVGFTPVMPTSPSCPSCLPGHLPMEEVVTAA